jgi:hypothetical protein
MLLDILSASPPVPITVSSPVNVVTETDWWLFGITLLGMLASAAVAIFTGLLAARTSALAGQTKRMADETADLARETLESIQVARSGNSVAEQHHQESQSPVVVLSSINLQLESSTNPGYRSVWTSVFKLSYRISNVGFGPALEIRVEACIDGVGAPKPISEPALPAGESRDPVGYHPIELTHVENVPILSKFPGASLRVTYKNVYARSRITEYKLRASNDHSDVVSEIVGPQELDETRLITWSVNP